MESAVKIHVDLFDVEKRLTKLELTVDILHDAIRAGYHSWSSCTELDPPMYAGISMWAHMVRRLRQRLLPEGWTHCDDGNYSTVRSPDGGLALAIATGDENTGRNGSDHPTTQSPKGPRTVEAVRVNSDQFELDLVFHDIAENHQAHTDETTETTTWILLVHRDDTVVRAELSHPLGLDENQRVSGWNERIILPIVEFAPNDEFDFGQDEEIDIDIPVKRRV